MARTAASVRESDTRFSLASITVPAPATGTMMRNELRKPHMRSWTTETAALESEMEDDLTQQHTSTHLALRKTRLMSGNGAFFQNKRRTGRSAARTEDVEGETHGSETHSKATHTHKKPLQRLCKRVSQSQRTDTEGSCC